MKTLLLLVALAGIGLVAAWNRQANDKIWNLPGLPYKSPFDMYSGYLNGGNVNNTDTFLFYWLTAYQFKDNDDIPIIVWLNGGPGCSSLGGLLEELGPVHTNERGNTLWENVFSWNKVGHVVYLESPAGVGFSFSSPKNLYWNDDMTAEMNANALNDFFMAYPHLAKRPLYLTGESYAGVYIPTLSVELIKRINMGKFANVNFKGAAIGNGYMDQKRLFNSLVNFNYYHGVIGEKMFSMAKEACCGSADANGDSCDFYTPLLNSPSVLTPNTSACANWSYIVGDLAPAMIPDPYNMYQSCYKSHNLVALLSNPLKLIAEVHGKTKKVLEQWTSTRTKPNYDSTNHLDGFACFSDSSNAIYFNRRDVQDALHVSDEWRRQHSGEWNDCNDFIFRHYDNQYQDVHTQFDYMLTTKINGGSPIRVMTYNGDVDTVCNFFGDEWFGHAVAKRNSLKNTVPRQTWFYGGKKKGNVAGRWEQFENLQILTVSGAGHFVPMDRAEVSLQMINNFINMKDYSMPSGIDVRYQKYYHPMHADKIEMLPGLPYVPPYDMFSGYLNGGTWEETGTNHLFYWLTKYQYPDNKDVPVILWLNGGPGCSSLGGLFTELGPFHPNKDGKTLWENVFSWNKVGHVVYLESPPGVGFSYNDKLTRTWTDDTTSLVNANALDDFFRKYPEFANRDFYITGESYGGIYIPTLSKRVVERINVGNFSNNNFRGFAIGNGCVGGQESTDSVINYLYYHGMFGEDAWEKLKKICCGSADANGRSCKFTENANKNSECNAMINHVFNSVDVEDPYNIYQQCFENSYKFPPKRAAMLKHAAAANPFISRLPADINPNQATVPDETTSNHVDGFGCWGSAATQQYLRLPEVQKALHVSPKWQEWRNSKWEDCNPLHYSTLYDSMQKQFDFLLKPFGPPGAIQNQMLRVMIYNGDVDIVCNFLGDEWFMHTTAHNNGLQVTTARKPWSYRGQLAGTEQTYDSGRFRIVTVNGAGHFVPTDRAGPALQMLYNFVNNRDLEMPVKGIDVKPQLYDTCIAQPQDSSTVVPPPLTSSGAPEILPSQ